MTVIKPTYFQLKAQAMGEFRRAVEERAFTPLQAFGYVYEGMDSHIEGEDEVMRVRAITAVFSTAADAKLQLPGHDPFVLEVLEWLMECYGCGASRDMVRCQSSSDDVGLVADMKTVTATYLTAS